MYASCAGCWPPVARLCLPARRRILVYEFYYYLFIL